MSLKLSRFVLIILIAGLFLVWLITLIFYSTDRLRFFIAASGIVFFLLLAALIFSFRKLFYSLRSMSNSAQLAAPALGSSLTLKHSPNELEFVSETFSQVVEQLQAKQKELNKLHNILSERAASAEAFSQDIISSLPSGLIAFDPNGLIRVINQPAKDIFELSENFETTSISYQNLFQSNLSLQQIITNSLIDNDFVSRIELDYRTQRGRLKKIGLTVAPIKINSQVSGVLCLISDITEINQLREQVFLRQNLESLGLMSAGLAHEFKNSLAALHLYTQFINRSNLESKAQEAAQGLSTELKGLSDMINSFLNFSRPQSLNLVRVDIQAMLEECINELQVIHLDKHFKCILTGSFDSCSGDVVLLRQVISNLLQNAAESILADSKSNGLITIKGILEVDQNHQSWAYLEISDNGAGIELDKLPFVFIPFFTTKKDGHGIGLALSHRIITQHGGTLTAKNAPAGGALFTIKLKTYTE